MAATSVHTAGVTGSNPVPPTMKIKHLQHLRVLFLFGVGKIWEKHPKPFRQHSCVCGERQPT